MEVTRTLSAYANSKSKAIPHSWRDCGDWCHQQGLKDARGVSPTTTPSTCLSGLCRRQRELGGGQWIIVEVSRGGGSNGCYCSKWGFIVGGISRFSGTCYTVTDLKNVLFKIFLKFFSIPDSKDHQKFVFSWQSQKRLYCPSQEVYQRSSPMS